MARRKERSISLPITLASVSVALSIAMIIGWIVEVSRRTSMAEEVARDLWLMVAGVASLVLIISVLIMFSVFLVREIQEGRRQTSFIDSVTHELKSPLASIRLCLETLERPELSAAQRESLRQMMLSDVGRLSAFIDDVLDANRVAWGRQTHLLASVKLAEVVRACVEDVAERYDLPPERIHVQVPADLSLMTDRTALETVLKNLLDNAIKYSDPPAEVRIWASREGADRVRVEVQDKGIGIDRRDLKRIFERFYRVPTEAVRTRRGTGLGLFVVAALVRSLGGRIQARSAGPGQGTSISVLLPRGAERDAA